MDICFYRPRAVGGPIHDPLAGRAAAAVAIYKSLAVSHAHAAFK